MAGTINKLFQGVKTFFRRKDKPPVNIKTINEVSAAPVVKGRMKRHRLRGNGQKPRPRSAM